jgi:hypothetical protein
VKSYGGTGLRMRVMDTGYGGTASSLKEVLSFLPDFNNEAFSPPSKRQPFISLPLENLPI